MSDSGEEEDVLDNQPTATTSDNINKTASEDPTMAQDATENAADTGDDDEDMEDGEMEEGEEMPDGSEEGAVDEDMQEDNNEQEEEPDEDAGETEQNEGENEQESPDEAKQEAAYSTRGRSIDHTSTDILDHLARASELLVREREHVPASMGASFLSESLTEEERRTRTRYLPDVEGFHALRKNEVKADLALARSTISSNGAAATIGKKKRSRDDEMEVDGEDGAPSEDDRSSDALRANAKVIEMGRNTYVLPATAFVAPPSTGTGVNGDSSQRGGKGSPSEVESVAAFNPPRPPESVGPKKKHRMMRWEQNPSSIEIDLANYRKTVQKTRQELKNAQHERERMISIDNHMRRNFFAHLQASNDELVQLSQELVSVQQECVNSADLLTSRTRSRGAGKSSYVMRDVLTVLRSRGAEMEEKNVSFDGATPVTSDSAGVGGLGAINFQDWDNSTTIESKRPAAGWIVAGDLVTTPYGDGKVVKILAPSEAGVNGAQPEGGAEVSNDSKSIGKSHYLAPRLAVELPFGIGYFSLSAVQSKETPQHYSDARLAQRWKGIIESAPAFGSFLDMEAMQNFLPRDEPETEAESMDVDDERKSDATGEKKAKPRLVPFGSDIIPTSIGRGGLLHHADSITLDKQLNPFLYDIVGVLGLRDNKGVPAAVHEVEDRKERFIRAKARSLQLTNALIRQRRITKMNEKALGSCQERSARVEALVTEMRSDLRSLKRRLDDEVQALGISDAEAGMILSEFYGSSDTQERP
jgi:hypothetical protein